MAGHAVSCASHGDFGSPAGLIVIGAGFSTNDLHRMSSCSSALANQRAEVPELQRLQEGRLCINIDNDGPAENKINRLERADLYF